MTDNLTEYRAAICTALNGPDSVEIQMLAARSLQAGEIRIQIKSAGLTFPDLLMTYGKYQFRPDPPFVAGTEFSGIIMEVADDVQGFTIGDRVMGGHKGECFAEQIIVDTGAVNILPDALSFDEGCCWYSAAITAWHALHDKAALEADETILILGASGGVGMAAVKLAKHMGAKIIATGSSPEKRNAILAAGADHALDPSNPELAKQVKSLTNGNGANVVYDPVGGDLSITATRAIAVGGRYLIVGFASGDIPSFPANHALIKEYSIMGLRAGESGRRDPELGKRNKEILHNFAKQGIMRPHISHSYKLEEISDGFRILESRKVIGRAIIKTS